MASSAAAADGRPMRRALQATNKAETYPDTATPPLSSAASVRGGPSVSWPAAVTDRSHQQNPSHGYAAAHAFAQPPNNALSQGYAHYPPSAHPPVMGHVPFLPPPPPEWAGLPAAMAEASVQRSRGVAGGAEVPPTQNGAASHSSFAFGGVPLPPPPFVLPPPPLHHLLGDDGAPLPAHSTAEGAHQAHGHQGNQQMAPQWGVASFPPAPSFPPSAAGFSLNATAPAHHTSFATPPAFGVPQQQHPISSHHLAAGPHMYGGAAPHPNQPFGAHAFQQQQQQHLHQRSMGASSGASIGASSVGFSNLPPSHAGGSGPVGVGRGPASASSAGPAGGARVTGTAPSGNNANLSAREPRGRHGRRHSSASSASGGGKDRDRPRRRRRHASSSSFSSESSSSSYASSHSYASSCSSCQSREARHRRRRRREHRRSRRHRSRSAAHQRSLTALAEESGHIDAHTAASRDGRSRSRGREGSASMTEVRRMRALQESAPKAMAASASGHRYGAAAKGRGGGATYIGTATGEGRVFEAHRYGGDAYTYRSDGGDGGGRSSNGFMRGTASSAGKGRAVAAEAPHPSQVHATYRTATLLRTTTPRRDGQRSGAGTPNRSGWGLNASPRTGTSAAITVRSLKGTTPSLSSVVAIADASRRGRDGRDRRGGGDTMGSSDEGAGGRSRRHRSSSRHRRRSASYEATDVHVAKGSYASRGREEARPRNVSYKAPPSRSEGQQPAPAAEGASRSQGRKGGNADGVDVALLGSRPQPEAPLSAEAAQRASTAALEKRMLDATAKASSYLEGMDQLYQKLQRSYAAFQRQPESFLTAYGGGLPSAADASHVGYGGDGFSHARPSSQGHHHHYQPTSHPSLPTHHAHAAATGREGSIGMSRYTDPAAFPLHFRSGETPAAAVMASRTDSRKSAATPAAASATDFGHTRSIGAPAHVQQAALAHSAAGGVVSAGAGGESTAKLREELSRLEGQWQRLSDLQAARDGNEGSPQAVPPPHSAAITDAAAVGAAPSSFVAPSFGPMAA